MDTLQTAFTSALPSLDSLPQPFPSLKLLLAAEEQDSKRIKVSKLGWWVDVKRIKGSTLPPLLAPLSLLTLYSSLIALLDLRYGRSFTLTNSVTPLLSVVVGLLLVWRNGSAYARWDEGGKSWARMTATVRALARSTWVGVGARGPDQGLRAEKGAENAGFGMGAGRRKDQEKEQGKRRRKEEALRLMVAFVVSVKHHLRGEFGVGYEDLAPLLPASLLKQHRSSGLDDDSTSPLDAAVGFGAELRHAASASSLRRESSTASQLHPQVDSARISQYRQHPTDRSSYHSCADVEREADLDLECQPSSSVSTSTYKITSYFLRRHASSAKAERAPLLSQTTANISGSPTVTRAEKPSSYLLRPSLPLPLLIAHHLSLYFVSFKRSDLLDSLGPAGYNAYQSSLSSLVAEFTAMERLSSSTAAGVGIPTLYGVHLKQVVSVFLATLPLVLVEQMGMTMIPFVGIVGFVMMGVEVIANQIQEPFGHDDSDLPLDLFCAEVRNEVEHVICCLPEELGEDWGW